MTSHGSFEIRSVNGVPVVEVEGDLDITNAAQFDAVLREVAATDAAVIVVSLARARYFDSKGIHMLYDFAQHLATTRRQLRLVAPSHSPAKRLLQIGGLTEAVQVFESVEQAISGTVAG